MADTLVVTDSGAVELLTVAEQGPPGPPGPPGPAGDADGALLVSNRLGELATDPAAQSDARLAIGAAASEAPYDLVAWYILAKL